MRRLGVLVISFACAGLAAFCAPAFAQTKLEVNPYNVNPGFQSDAQGAMRSARERVAAGDMKGAIGQLAIYVAAHPGEADPARLLGDLYYRAGDLGRAESTYRQIVRNYPRDKETHNRLGTVLATENRLDDAIAEYNASLPGTDSVSPLVDLHIRKGDAAQYVSDLERTARNFPTDADAQTELAQAYAALHRPIDAIKYYRRALDNAPEDLMALNGLGSAYMDLHQYQQANDAFDQCLRINRQDYACLNDLGASYLESRRLDEAKVELTKAHDEYPELPEALVNFGYLADSRGQWKEGVTWYVKALEMSPFSRDAYLDLGLEYQEHKLYQQAEAVLVKGISVAPEDGRLHEVLGETYASTGKRDLAIAQFKAAAASMDPAVASLARHRVASFGVTPPTPHG